MPKEDEFGIEVRRLELLDGDDLQKDQPNQAAGEIESRIYMIEPGPEAEDLIRQGRKVLVDTVNEGQQGVSQPPAKGAEPVAQSAAPAIQQAPVVQEFDRDTVLRKIGSKFVHNQVESGICSETTWEKVLETLERDNKALLAIWEMMKAGHQPLITYANKKGFEVITGSRTVPYSTRNCVFDEEAANWLRRYRPEEVFNGSAEAQAKKMGIEVMTARRFAQIKNYSNDFGLRRETSWHFLKPFFKGKGHDRAKLGYWYDDWIVIQREDARRHDTELGWRGRLWVNWVKK